jgi:phage-related protein
MNTIPYSEGVTKVKAESDSMASKTTTDQEKMRSEMTKTGEKATSVGDIFKGIMASNIVMAATQGISNFFEAGLEKAKEASAVDAQLEAGIESTGNTANVTVAHMKDLARSIQDYSGQTEDSITKTESLLQTFGNIRNTPTAPVFDEATRAAADMAAKMGGDATDMALKLGKALNDPTQGLGALSRAGVQFTQSQKDSIKAMQEHGDLAGAQALILEELTKKFGGAAEAAGKTLPGELSRLKLSFTDLAGSIITAFLPIVLPVMDAITKAVQALTPLVDKVTGAFVSLGERVKGVFKEAGGGVEGFDAVLQNTVGSIEEFISGGGLMKMLQSFSDLRTRIMTTVLDALPGIIDAFVQFVPMFIEFITGTFIPAIVDQFSKIVTNIMQVLSAGLPKIIAAFYEVGTKLVLAVAAMLPEVVRTLLGMVPTLLTTALQLFKSIVDAVVETVPVLISTISGMLPGLMKTIVGMLPGILDAAINLFLGIVQGLVEVIPVLLKAIIGALPDIVKTIATMLPAIIDGAFKLFTGLVTGLLKMLPELIDSLITDVLPAVYKAIADSLPEIIDASISLFVGIVDGLTRATPQIIRAIIDMAPSFHHAFMAILPEMIDAGWQLLQGLVKGLVDNAPRMFAAIAHDLGSMLIDNVKAIFGIASPSKVFAEMGKNIGEGLVNGIQGSMDSVNNAASTLANGALDAFGKPQFTVGSAIAANSIVPGSPGVTGMVTTPTSSTNIQTVTPTTAAAPVPAQPATQNINVYASTNASPLQIASTVGWQLRMMG